jgi:hypothetical protein
MTSEERFLPLRRVAASPHQERRVGRPVDGAQPAVRGPQRDFRRVERSSGQAIVCSGLVCCTNQASTTRSRVSAICHANVSSTTPTSISSQHLGWKVSSPRNGQRGLVVRPRSEMGGAASLATRLTSTTSDGPEEFPALGPDPCTRKGAWRASRRSSNGLRFSAPTSTQCGHAWHADVHLTRRSNNIHITTEMTTPNVLLCRRSVDRVKR